MGWLRKNLEMLLHWSSSSQYEDEFSDRAYADDAFRKGESPCLLALEKKAVIASNPQTTPLFLAECLHDLAVAAEPATVGVWEGSDFAYGGGSVVRKIPNAIYSRAEHNALGDVVRLSEPIMQKRGTHREAITYLHRLAARDFEGIGRYGLVDHAHHDSPACDYQFEETCSLHQMLQNKDFTPEQIRFRIILKRWHCSGNPRGTLAWNERASAIEYRIAIEPKHITTENSAALYALATSMFGRGYTLGDRTHPQFKERLTSGRF